MMRVSAGAAGIPILEFRTFSQPLLPPGGFPARSDPGLGKII
jgi:hypothetical protein